ncbi:uncharacterized protein [Choristoneura fumiferana]|uniref:uncharacterized protein n=1 Tax=Choristoneura fumiferana TaxID=7141 RepID=UPI003D15EDEB
MKLIIILSVVAWSSCAKLDRNYLPPSNAGSSGGSPFLQAPNSGSNLRGTNRNYQDNGFGRSNDFSQGNGLEGDSNDFNNGNDFNQNGFNGGNFNGDGFARAERPQAAFERNAAILRQDSQNDGETYSYAYETENGIYAEESGVATNGVEAQGSYSYTGDDGQVYTVRYTADQNGFVPVGDHIPTPPPVPEEILKALEQNARDEAAGIYDDGSYTEGKYEDSNQYSNYNNNGNGNNYNNGNGFNNGNNFNNANNYNANNYNNGNDFSNSDFNGNDEDTVVTDAAVFRSNQASRGFDGATKAYLPPTQNQRAQGRNGLGPRSRTRPSFNARDGYNY